MTNTRGTAGRQKQQFMVLLDPREGHRIDALRIVMGLSRAEIIRRIVRGESLNDLEGQYAERLTRLIKLARNVGSGLDLFVHAISFNRKIIPILEELEGMQLDELRKIIANVKRAEGAQPTLRREELFRAPSE